MSGATQQKKKEGVKGKRKSASASSHGRQGASAGSAAAGHAVGARHDPQRGSSEGPARGGGVTETGGGDGRAATPGGDGGGFGD